MKTIFVVAFFVGIAFCASYPKKYNVIWNSAGTSRDDSMPIGNGRIGANVYYLPHESAVTLLLAATDSWSETAQLFKPGLVRIKMDPNPMESLSTFHQELDLSTATIILKLGNAQNQISFNIWADIENNVIHVEASSKIPYTITLETEIWRTNDSQPLWPHLQMWLCDNYTIGADVLVEKSSVYLPNSIIWYHRNPYSVTADLSSFQGVSDLYSEKTDPLFNRTFGAAIIGDKNFHLQNASLLVSKGAVSSFSLQVFIHSNRTKTVEDWLIQLGNLATKINYKASLDAHKGWWKDFWARSYVEIGDNIEFNTFVVGQKYVLHRFLSAVNMYKSDFPMKFNGMMFTCTKGLEFDDRAWAGGNWWQNLRLPYYPLFGSGDFDMFHSLFRYMNDQFTLAKGRCKEYFGHEGVFWPETIGVSGLYTGFDYGCGSDRDGFPPEIPWTRWNRYNYQQTLDFATFVLDYFDFTQDQSVLAEYLPIMDETTKFYENHWHKQDGKLYLYPSQAIETWECITYPPNISDCVVNDTPDVAGLTSVLPRLLKLPKNLVTQEQLSRWKKLEDETPAIPQNDTNILAGDLIPENPSNVENPELYTVHPYRLYTVGNGANLTKAITSFWGRVNQFNYGWAQDVMEAALLGLSDEAWSLVLGRAYQNSATGYRFPAFMPSDNDFPPSADHLSNMNTAIQWMLIQSDVQAPYPITLFPAWPCDLDVSFKLHTTLKTSIEVIYANKTLVSLKVSPQSRASDVKWANCVSNK